MELWTVASLPVVGINNKVLTSLYRAVDWMQITSV